MESVEKIEYEYGIALSAKRPKGGWVFKEDGVVFEGDSHNDLVRRVRKYRINHGKEYTDVDSDVRRYICERNPTLCRVKEKKPEKNEEDVTPSKVAATWLLGITTGGEYKRVFPETKSRRSDICRSCPKNRADIHPEDEVGQGHEYRLQTSTRGRFDGSLGICECHGHDNRVAVWLMGLKPSDDQPENCWIGNAKLEQ